MPFLLTKQNVEDLKTDAKVIGSCPYRSPSRSQSWQPDLWAERRRIQELSPGESIITSGMEFDAKCGIITKPPIWEGGQRKEDLKLACCYDSALRLAHRRRCKSIAFPLLSADCHGFPKDLALRTAIATIREFLNKYEITVYLSVREPSALQVLDDHYSRLLDAIQREEEQLEQDEPLRPVLKIFEKGSIPGKHREPDAEQQDIFSQYLQQIISQKGLKETAVYKKANLDRKQFFRICGHGSHLPSKQTVLALALALELDLNETMVFLGKAGYVLKRTSKADIILGFFIREGNYDIYEINQMLFAFDQPLLGS